MSTMAAARLSLVAVARLGGQAGAEAAVDAGVEGDSRASASRVLVRHAGRARHPEQPSSRAGARDLVRPHSNPGEKVPRSVGMTKRAPGAVPGPVTPPRLQQPPAGTVPVDVSRSRPTIAHPFGTRRSGRGRAARARAALERHRSRGGARADGARRSTGRIAVSGSSGAGAGRRDAHQGVRQKVDRVVHAVPRNRAERDRPPWLPRATRPRRPPSDRRSGCTRVGDRRDAPHVALATADVGAEEPRRSTQSALPATRARAARAPPAPARRHQSRAGGAEGVAVRAPPASRRRGQGTEPECRFAMMPNRRAADLELGEVYPRRSSPPAPPLTSRRRRATVQPSNMVPHGPNPWRSGPAVAWDHEPSSAGRPAGRREPHAHRRAGAGAPRAASPPARSRQVGGSPTPPVEPRVLHGEVGRRIGLSHVP